MPKWVGVAALLRSLLDLWPLRQKVKSRTFPIIIPIMITFVLFAQVFWDESLLLYSASSLAILDLVV